MVIQLRAFFVVVEAGSISSAAARLRQSQSALTRQMQALEDEVGGRLFERTHTGVHLTAAGHLLADTMRPIVTAYERGLAEVSELLKHGERKTLRVGYLPSAAQAYLDPALATLRRTHPQVKIVLNDLFPGEQIALLRRGEIDVALVGQESRAADREFYTRKLATLPLVVILPADHPLAARPSVHLAELRGERFVRVADEHLPGRNRWITQLCRTAGFRAKFGSTANDLSHSLSLVASEGLAGLGPAFLRDYPAGGVRMVPLADPAARWDMLVVWQRGHTAGALRALLDALAAAAVAARKRSWEKAAGLPMDRVRDFPASK